MEGTCLHGVAVGPNFVQHLNFARFEPIPLEWPKVTPGVFEGGKTPRKGTKGCGVFIEVDTLFCTIWIMLSYVKSPSWFALLAGRLWHATRRARKHREWRNGGMCPLNTTYPKWEGCGWFVILPKPALHHANRGCEA